MSYIQQDLTPQARGDTWNLEFLMQDSTGAIIDITETSTGLRSSPLWT